MKGTVFLLTQNHHPPTPPSVWRLRGQPVRRSVGVTFSDPLLEFRNQVKQLSINSDSYPEVI